MTISLNNRKTGSHMTPRRIIIAVLAAITLILGITAAANASQTKWSPDVLRAAQQVGVSPAVAAKHLAGSTVTDLKALGGCRISGTVCGQVYNMGGSKDAVLITNQLPAEDPTSQWAWLQPGQSSTSKGAAFKDTDAFNIPVNCVIRSVYGTQQSSPLVPDNDSTANWGRWYKINDVTHIQLYLQSSVNC